MHVHGSTTSSPAARYCILAVIELVLWAVWPVPACKVLWIEVWRKGEPVLAADDDAQLALQRFAEMDVEFDRGRAEGWHRVVLTDTATLRVVRVEFDGCPWFAC